MKSIATSRVTFVLAVMALVIGFSVHLATAAILMDPTTNNGSFESAPNIDSTPWASAGNEPGWTLTQGDPNRNYHMMNGGAQNGANHEELENQTIITSVVIGTVQANTDYTISGWTAQNGYHFSLRANGVAIAEAVSSGLSPDIYPPPTANGVWTQFSDTATAASLVGNIGQNLDVTLYYSAIPGGRTWADVDNIVVSSNPIPEPAGFAAVAAAIAFGLRQRRKM